MGLRNRLLEVALAALVSMLASAFVTSWTLSAKLANFENGIKANTDSIALMASGAQQVRSSVSAVENINATQNAAIAVSDTRWLEVQRRLGSIETKVDDLTRRR